MIYLVRHGQTVFNVERRFQGGVNSPLTALGEAQAKSMGRLFRHLTAGEDRWTIVSSPLGRARQTAGIIHAEMGRPREIEFDERLREISLGEWDGLTRSELAARIGVESDDFADRQYRNFTDWWFRAPGGETFDGFFGRLRSWLYEAQGRGENLIVVSHGGSGRMIRGAYLDLSLDEMFELDAPHDVIFHLANGTIGRIDCEVTEGS